MDAAVFLARVAERVRGIAEVPLVAAPPVARARDLIAAFESALIAVGGSVQRTRSGADLKCALDTVLGDGPVVAWDPAELAPLDVAEILARHRAIAFEGGDGATFRAACADAAIGVTSVHLAVAETGSLVLGCAPSRARSVSLLPCVHVALVPASRIVGTLDDAFAELGELASQVVFVTGPSRTSDIENDLTIGVHGPAAVVALLVEDL